MTDQSLQAQIAAFVARERALIEARGKGGQHVGRSPSITPSVLHELERMLRDTAILEPPHQERRDETTIMESCSSTEVPEAADGGVQTHSAPSGLQWIVGNCYTLARRELNRLRRQAHPDPVSIERWGHVIRLCEGAAPKTSVLRWSLPTEITDGEPAPPDAHVERSASDAPVTAQHFHCPICGASRGMMCTDVTGAPLDWAYVERERKASQRNATTSPTRDVLPWLKQAIVDYESEMYRPSAHYLSLFRGAVAEIERLRLPAPPVTGEGK